MAGLPVVTDSGVVLSPPAWAERLVAARAGYLFLDELTTCPRQPRRRCWPSPWIEWSVILPCPLVCAWLLERTRQTALLMAGNSALPGEQVLPRRLRADRRRVARRHDRRVVCAARITRGHPDPARIEGAKALVTGFIRRKPEHLHTFPTTAEATGQAWPSRRTWAMLAAALAHVRDDDAAARQRIVFGLVGKESAWSS